MLTVLLIALLLVDVLVISFCANHEKPFWGLFGFLTAGVVAHFLGYPVLVFLKEHLSDIPLWFGAYVLLGIPWAFSKWWMFALRARTRLKEWMVAHPAPVDDGKFTADEMERKVAMYRSGVPRPVVYNPKTGKFSLDASEHKGRITTWLALWPFSIVGTILDDFLVRLWENLYEALSTSFQRVSDSVFSDINK